MLSDEQYQLCKPILDKQDVDDADKVEQMEEVLQKEAKLSGPALENAVMNMLWRHRNGSKGSDDIPQRHTIIRKASPAPWQMNRAPTPSGSPMPSSSPSLPAGFPAARPSYSRQRSTASPFASPKPSPRLALAQPIPHSPSLNAYEFSDPSPAPDIYGDFGSDTVDWLVADDAVSVASSTGTGSLSAAAAEWVPQPSEMSPYDMLRSVLGDQMSDEQIEAALEEHSYDMSATIADLLGSDNLGLPIAKTKDSAGVLIGKHLAPAGSGRLGTPGGPKSPIVCKYWLASGSCLRADCRFAHDTSGYLCKYWMNGQCLAGSDCQFSHDPSVLMTHLNLNDQIASAGLGYNVEGNADQFPALGPNVPRGPSATSQFNPAASGFSPSLQRAVLAGFSPGSRPQSRPSSRHQNRPATPSSLSMDDPDAFPSLGSLSSKRGAKHHGHRSRHGGPIERESPSTLADLVKMSPSPNPAQLRRPEMPRKVRTLGADSAAAKRIPEPTHIPWLETGTKANEQYLKHRADAIKHGSIRNKFLQSAAQAWNRNDARAAKALSLRGQAENEEMRKAHRAAAKALYEERNEHLRDGEQQEELYIDLHGLHPEEAIEYLEDILKTHEKQGRRIIYAITGTGHHSKNGKDKVGKGVRNWLNEWGYTFREFSVPGERGGYIGGVLGIDITSHHRQPTLTDGRADASPLTTTGSGKIQILKREELAA